MGVPVRVSPSNVAVRLPVGVVVTRADCVAMACGDSSGALEVGAVTATVGRVSLGPAVGMASSGVSVDVE
jgi:hypothetical protein